MTNSHLTAITRTKPSAPMQFLHENGLLSGEVLDYGCGKGYDVKHFKIDGYDPYFQPTLKPYKQYDTVVCNYVLNTLEPHCEHIILKDILTKKLKHTGVAYITVRNDIKEDGETSKGTYQRKVKLTYPVVKQTKNYVMYKIVKTGGQIYG